MSISAQIRDEEWNVIESSIAGNFQQLSNRAHRLKKTMLACLEPYGMTVFNARQLPYILLELEDIWEQEPQGIEEVAEELRRLSEKVIESRFLLLVFIGD